MTGLAELAARLGRLDLEPTQRRALAEGARRVEAALRAALAELGHGEHEPRAARAGVRDSIAHRVEADRATVGSTSAAAMRQELGNRGAPPRPIMAPVAAELGAPVARAIGAALAEAIRVALAGGAGD